MDAEKKEKYIQVHELYNKVIEKRLDRIFVKFFDGTSKKMLDEKIRVLTGLIDGTIEFGSPEYYSILELYPPEHVMWD